MISAIWSGSAVSPAMIRRPSVGDRSRIRPRCSASSANAVTVEVNDLVAATDISGPGVQVDAAVDLAGDGRADHVDDADHPAALALQLLHRGQGVDGLAGLADRDVERVRLDHRVAVAELGGGLGGGRHPGQVLDQLRAQVTGVAGRAAAEDLHPAERAGLPDGQVEPAQVRGLETLVDAPAQRPLDGPRLLVDLLDQEVRVVRRSRRPTTSQSMVDGLLATDRSSRVNVR